MKKLKIFTVLICSLFILSPSIFAGEKLIVKQNKTIYLFRIENFGEEKQFVLSETFVEPDFNYFISLNLPKQAWNIMTRVEDGIYFTYTDKQDVQIKALREENAKLKQTVSKNIVNRNAVIWTMAIGAVLIIVFVLYIIISGENNLQKKMEAQKNQIKN